MKVAKTVSDARKFAKIKARWTDISRSHGADIKENNFLRMAAGTVTQEVLWLIKEVERLAQRDDTVPNDIELSDAEEKEIAETVG